MRLILRCCARDAQILETSLNLSCPANLGLWQSLVSPCFSHDWDGGESRVGSDATWTAYPKRDTGISWNIPITLKKQHSYPIMKNMTFLQPKILILPWEWCSWLSWICIPHLCISYVYWWDFTDDHAASHRAGCRITADCHLNLDHSWLFMLIDSSCFFSVSHKYT